MEHTLSGSADSTSGHHCFVRVCLVFALLLVSALNLPAYSAEPNRELPDSSNFLKASVLVSSPGDKLQSCLGHVALRMECPVHSLDYCFSFLMDDDTHNIVRFFMGETNGKIMAIDTPGYLKSFENEGRRVEQYTLNLSLHEMQRLWMLLDRDNVDPEYRCFNFIANNCTSAVIMALTNAMIEGDSLNFVWPEQAINVDNAKGIRYITRDTPWLQFILHLLIGTEGETEWHNSHRMSPELLVSVLENSTIASTDASRPLLVGEKTVLVEADSQFETSWFTPTVLFASILALVLLISLAEWLLRWVTAARIMDVVLLVAQTLAGLALCYMTLHTGLFGKHWNWMLIPLNPLPLLFWLLWHRRRWWYRIYLGYAVVLWAFIVAAALWLSTIIAPLLLLTAIFAVRSSAKYLLMRRRHNIEINKSTNYKSFH